MKKSGILLSVTVRGIFPWYLAYHQNDEREKRRFIRSVKALESSYALTPRERLYMSVVLPVVLPIISLRGKALPD